MPEQESELLPEPPPAAKLSIYEALPLVTAAIGAVGKTNRNKDQGYAFRGIDDVVNGIHGLFAKYGVGLIPRIVRHEQTEVQSKSGTRGWHTIVHMQYKMTARDGSHEIGEGLGESLAYDDKGTPKAQAMAFKYFLTQAFTIPTQENLDTEYDRSEDLAPPTSRAPDPQKGEQSVHAALRGANEGRSGPRPPRAEKASTGLAGSSIEGLKKAPSAEQTTETGAGDIVPLDEWDLDKIRKLPAVSGKPLGSASPKQLQQIVSMGDEYVAHGQKQGKGDIAVAAVEGAKLLLKSMQTAEETDEISM